MGIDVALAPEATDRVGGLRVTVARIVAGVLALPVLALPVVVILGLFSGDPDSIQHRTHETTVAIFFGVMFATSLVAIVLRPAVAPGAIRVMLIGAAVAIVVSLALSSGVDLFSAYFFLAPALVATIGGFRVWRGPWVTRNRLVVLPALMLLGFAPYLWGQFGLQLNGLPTNPHVEMGHYAVMVTVVAAVALCGLVASAPVRGRFFAGTSMGVAAVLLGLASLITHQVSSFGLLGDLALILGGLAFVGQVQMERLDNPAV